MKRRVAGAVLFCALISCAAHASPDRVKFLEGPAAAKLSQAGLDGNTTGYLPADAPDIIAALNPPPPVDTAADKADVALFREIRASARDERWKIASEDDASVYDRFEGALGIMPDRAHLPSLVRLLNRVAEDTLAITAEAKSRFARPRPNQRFILKHVCSGASPAKGSSYPSGHAAVSWASALVMMEVAPANAQNLISRAVSYGNSRIICGLHFPADVEAGHFLGAAVVDRLFADPVFRRDLQCAKREFNAVAAGEKAEDLAACPFQ